MKSLRRLYILVRVSGKEIDTRSGSGAGSSFRQLGIFQARNGTRFGFGKFKCFKPIYEMIILGQNF